MANEWRSTAGSAEAAETVLEHRMVWRFDYAVLKQRLSIRLRAYQAATCGFPLPYTLPWSISDTQQPYHEHICQIWC